MIRSTQITQIKKISHEKAQEAQKENAKGSMRKAPLFATANSSSAEAFFLRFVTFRGLIL